MKISRLLIVVILWASLAGCSEQERVSSVPVSTPNDLRGERTEEQAEELDDSEAPGYCQGNEIVCVEHFEASTVAQQGGTVHGGYYENGLFTPSNRGGLEFSLDLDFRRNFMIEIKIEGNIANANRAESEGGKVSLFDMHDRDGPYLLSAQRMYNGYRGIGVFRIMHGLGDDAIARVITTEQLSGEYSMKDWGNEPHTIRLEVDGANCRLLIDHYTSRWGTGTKDLGGTRSVTFILGNRVERYDNQHAITQFARFKITYL